MGGLALEGEGGCSVAQQTPVKPVGDGWGSGFCAGGGGGAAVTKLLLPQSEVEECGWGGRDSYFSPCGANLGVDP